MLPWLVMFSLEAGGLAANGVLLLVMAAAGGDAANLWLLLGVAVAVPVYAYLFCVVFAHYLHIRDLGKFNYLFRVTGTYKIEKLLKLEYDKLFSRMLP